MSHQPSPGHSERVARFLCVDDDGGTRFLVVSVRGGRGEMQQARNRRARVFSRLSYARKCSRRRIGARKVDGRAPAGSVVTWGGASHSKCPGLVRRFGQSYSSRNQKKFSKNKKYQNERNNYISELRSRPRGWRGKFPVSYSSSNLKIHKS